jgi:HAMP domain-containing protein
MSRIPTRGLVLALGLLALATACGKGAAEQALSAASSALDQARPEIEKYVPGELTAITSAMSKARAAFDKGDYKGALAAGQGVVGKVQAALEAAKKRKDELVAAFGQLRSTLPAMVDALKGRLGALASAKTLPAGLDKETVETAQANLETVGRSWSDAMSKFDSGDIVTAMTQANDVKTKVEEMAKAFLPAAPAHK